MKKALLLLMTFFSATAYAAPSFLSNFYLNAFYGLNFIESIRDGDAWLDFDTGYVAGGAVGYRLFSLIRIEGEAAYRSNSPGQIRAFEYNFPVSGRCEKVTSMGNIIIDIPLMPNFVPYIGVGFGQKWQKNALQIEPIIMGDSIIYYERSIEKISDLVGQGIVGFHVIKSGKIDLSGEYRYFNAANREANHTLMGTLRFFL